MSEADQVMLVMVGLLILVAFPLFTIVAGWWGGESWRTIASSIFALWVVVIFAGGLLSLLVLAAQWIVRAIN